MTFRNILKGATLALLVSIAFSACTKEEEVEKKVESFSYAFNIGQIAAAFTYTGTHASTLSADLKLEEQDNGTLVTITLNNTINGETYHIHAHDAADASVTPNGTPYNEAPNGDVLVQQIVGNGGSVSASQSSSMTIDELTTSYEGFLVVHDPLQAVSTTDPGTFVILASFGK